MPGSVGAGSTSVALPDCRISTAKQSCTLPPLRAAVVPLQLLTAAPPAKLAACPDADLAPRLNPLGTVPPTVVAAESHAKSAIREVLSVADNPKAGNVRAPLL